MTVHIRSELQSELSPSQIAVSGFAAASTSESAYRFGLPGRMALNCGAMSWFKRLDNEIVSESERTVRTEGLWVKCPDCGKPIFRAELDANLRICPHCGHHFKMDARTRIANL